MDCRWILSCIAAGLLFMGVGSSAFALSELIGTVHVYLYAGRTAEAALVMKTRLFDLPDDDQARLALGAV